jgi:hypothetical protein
MQLKCSLTVYARISCSFPKINASMVVPIGRPPDVVILVISRRMQSV